MDRRAFLAATGGTAGALAGCATLELSATLDVAAQPVTYLAGAAEATALRQAVDPSDLKSEEEIPAVLRDALQRALEDEFVVDSVSTDLLAAIDEFREPTDNYRLETPAVRLDGTAYVFEARVPTLVVQLGDESAENVDPDAVFRTERLQEEDSGLEPTAESLVERLRYRGPNAPRLPYRASDVPASIADFLETYDYVEDSQGVAPIETERLHAEPPYTIEVREFTVEDRYGRPVVDAAALDADLRQFVRDVIESSRDPSAPPYLTDTVPDGFFEQLKPTGDYRTDPFVHLDGSVYYVGVTEGEHGRMPVDLSADSMPPGENGRDRFRLTVAATAGGSESDVGADESIELFGHVGLPSVLWIDDGDELHLLKSDAYEYPVESQSTPQTSTAAGLFLTVDGRDVEVLTAERETRSTEWSLDLDVEQVRKTTVFETLAVGSELSAVYEIPDAVAAGTYASPGFFGARWGRESGEWAHEGIYPFEVEVVVE